MNSSINYIIVYKQAQEKNWTVLDISSDVLHSLSSAIKQAEDLKEQLSKLAAKKHHVEIWRETTSVEKVMKV